MCSTADGLQHQPRVATAQCAAQHWGLLAQSAPPTPGRSRGHSRHSTADSGHCLNSSSTPGPSCRRPDSWGLEFPGRERRFAPSCSISWRRRIGRGTCRSGRPGGSGRPARRRRNAESERRGPGKESPNLVHRVWASQSIRQDEIGPEVAYNSFSSPPERSPSNESRYHEPSVENLLFATEERWLSPDSVRLLYHVTGGKSSTIHAPCPPGPETAAGWVRGKARKGHSKCRAVPPENRVTPLSDVSPISGGSASPRKRTAGHRRYEDPGLFFYWVAPACSWSDTCVAAANLAAFSPGDNRSHVAGQPGQQNATFCPLRSRTRLAGTLVACMGVPIMGQFVLANTGCTCRSSAVCAGFQG